MNSVSFLVLRFMLYVFDLWSFDMIYLPALCDIFFTFILRVLHFLSLLFILCFITPLLRFWFPCFGMILVYQIFDLSLVCSFLLQLVLSQHLSFHFLQYFDILILIWLWFSDLNFILIFFRMLNIRLIIYYLDCCVSLLITFITAWLSILISHLIYLISFSLAISSVIAIFFNSIIYIMNNIFFQILIFHLLQCWVIYYCFDISFNFRFINIYNQYVLISCYYFIMMFFCDLLDVIDVYFDIWPLSWWSYIWYDFFELISYI